mgnify:FL=1|tara:strand:+ start:316 stop:777 length:462 start_codon:yes stop_codon:yes gene_type:complete
MKKIVKLLKKKKLKFAVAESCTGGLVSSSMTAINGSSEVFTMGLVTYSNKSKIDILNVPKNIIKKYGAVSSQCCMSMLKGLAKLSKSKICISITGIAGPKGGTKKKPVGLVYVGVKNGTKISINEFKFKNKGRIFIQKTTVKKTFDLVLKSIN